MQWHFMLRDDYSLPAIHIALLLAVVYAFIRHAYNRRGGTTLTVKRGPETMAKLAGGFAVVTIGMTLAVDVADAWNGFKTVAITVDYCLLAYLFFWNVWFRNKYLQWVINAHNESV